MGPWGLLGWGYGAMGLYMFEGVPWYAIVHPSGSMPWECKFQGPLRMKEDLQPLGIPWEPGRLKLLAALPVKPGHCLGWHVANGSVSSVAFVETRPYQQRWILPDGISGCLIAGGVQNVLEKEPK